MVRLDEAHATHISSQVEHPVAILCDLQAVLKHTKIHMVKLVAELLLLEVLVLAPVSNNDLRGRKTQANANALATSTFIKKLPSSRRQKWFKNGSKCEISSGFCMGGMWSRLLHAM